MNNNSDLIYALVGRIILIDENELTIDSVKDEMATYHYVSIGRTSNSYVNSNKYSLPIKCIYDDIKLYNFWFDDYDL